MQFIKWLDMYELGVPVLDFQHKNLIFLLNDTYRAFFMRGEGEKLVKEVIDNFVNFYSSHFSTEEKFMRMVEYPMFYHHKKMHEKIINLMDGYKKEFEEKGEIDIGEFLSTLNNWVFEHLTIEDMKLKEHLYYVDKETIFNYNSKIEEEINNDAIE